MNETAASGEARQFLAQHPDIAEISLLISDLNGIIRGKRVARGALERVYGEGVCLPGSLFGTDVTGKTVEATGLGLSQGDADRVCRPVPGTLRPIPWSVQPAAQLLMSMYEENGEPFFADPRHVLAQVVSRLAADGLHPVVAVEMEFYLLDRERDHLGRPRPPRSPVTGRRDRQTQVYGISELDEYGELLKDMAAAAAEQAIPADTAVSEYAPGQYEINLHHEPDPVSACDHAVLLKRLIKGVAGRHGMDATFMAKPYPEQSGSGMHVHVSVVDAEGRNVFVDEHNGDTPRLAHAIGGLLRTMPEAIALFAPNVNSLRRFQPGAYVPLAPTWGYNNRTTALRVPAGPASSRRIEHRVAGADANTYLVVAALLAGLHYGIAAGIEPGPAIEGDAERHREPAFTRDPGRALSELAASDVLADYLGRRFLEVYVACKQAELEEFALQVTPLELDWYLRAV